MSICAEKETNCPGMKSRPWPLKPGPFWASKTKWPRPGAISTRSISFGLHTEASGHAIQQRIDHRGMAIERASDLDLQARDGRGEPRRSAAEDRAASAGPASGSRGSPRSARRRGAAKLARGGGEIGFAAFEKRGDHLAHSRRPAPARAQRSAPLHWPIPRSIHARTRCSRWSSIHQADSPR